MFGFTINGKHSYNDYGIILGKFNIPMRGDIQEYIQHIPGVQGEIQLQQPDLKDMVIDLKECYIQIDPNTVQNTNAFQALQKKARAIKAWLNPQQGKQYITFDNDTGISYYGVGNAKIDTDMLGVARGFSITFRCDPYLYSSVPASAYNAGQYDSTLPYDSGAEYGQPITNPTVNTSGSFNMWNGGNVDVPPVITITPVTSGQTFSNLTITNNTTGKSISWNGSVSTSLVIDNKNKVIYSTSGTTNVNEFLHVSGGDFFTLAAGVTNNFTVTVTGSIQLSFDYRFMF